MAVPSSHAAATYLQALHRLGCEVDAWETTYLHVLEGEDPVFTWVSGTGATADAPGAPGRSARAVRGGVQATTPGGVPASDGRVVLPFRRIFVVARTSDRVAA